MTNTRLLNFSFFGILSFFILTIIAMAIFPGGTIFDADLDSYSFLNNFFSDLGRTTDFEGNKNPTQYIFTAALIMVSLSMFSFFAVSYNIFSIQRFQKMNLASIVFGIIASIGYVGIAFTPWDVVRPAHELAVQIGFISFWIMSILLTIMIYGIKDYPNLYGHVFILFDIILIGYIFLMFLGPDPRADVESLTIQVIGQKIVVYSEIICMLVQIRGAKNYVTHL